DELRAPGLEQKVVEVVWQTSAEQVHQVAQHHVAARGRRSSRSAEAVDPADVVLWTLAARRDAELLVEARIRWRLGQADASVDLSGSEVCDGDGADLRVRDATGHGLQAQRSQERQGRGVRIDVAAIQELPHHSPGDAFLIA